LQNESKRRFPKKGISNKKVNDLINQLQTEELPEVDKAYVSLFLETYKSKLVAAIEEANSEVQEKRSAIITIPDRLRLIEAFVCDEAKQNMLSSQDCLTRQQLDARNSVHASVDYFQVVSEKFNNPSWVPRLTVMGELHPELEEPRDLPLKEYRTTRAKAKDKYDEMKKLLHSVVNKWELSGNGGQQRSEDAEDYGYFDPYETTEGDNRRSFLPNDGQYYLLYFWQRLEDEDCLQTTLAKLPDSMMANSDHFSLTSSINPTPQKKDAATVAAERVANAIDGVADAINRSQDEKLMVDLNVHETQLLDLNLKIFQMTEDDPSREFYLVRKRQLQQIIDAQRKKLSM
jgi:hypothetical protein